jgi:hypothetical protein
LIINAELLVLLATVAFMAGFGDTLAGGGLIGNSVFLFAGFTAAQALATNK